MTSTPTASSSVPSSLSSTTLPLPDFNIDENDKNIELWTFRLPVTLPVSALKNATLDLSSGNGHAEFSHDGTNYKMQLMNQSEEHEFFRVLVPTDNNDKDDESDKDSDDDDDDDDEEGDDFDKTGGTLQPCPTAFSKHVTVVTAVPQLTETQLAPREGPPPADRMRHAYAPIAQRGGLKRRWMPLGVAAPASKSKPSRMTGSSSSTSTYTTTKKRKTQSGRSVSITDDATAVKMDTETPLSLAAPTPSSNTRKNKGEDNDDSEASSPEGNELTKSEKKAKKAAKKASKKAKKEAKKEKKSAKKAKKSKVKEEP